MIFWTTGTKLCNRQIKIRIVTTSDFQFTSRCKIISSIAGSWDYNSTSIGNEYYLEKLCFNNCFVQVCFKIIKGFWCEIVNVDQSYRSFVVSMGSSALPFIIF